MAILSTDERNRVAERLPVWAQDIIFQQERALDDKQQAIDLLKGKIKKLPHQHGRFYEQYHGVEFGKAREIPARSMCLDYAGMTLTVAPRQGRITLYYDRAGSHRYTDAIPVIRGNASNSVDIVLMRELRYKPRRRLQV